MKSTAVEIQATKSSTVRPVTIQIVTSRAGASWLTVTDNGTGRQVVYEIDAENTSKLAGMFAVATS